MQSNKKGDRIFGLLLTHDVASENADEDVVVVAGGAGSAAVAKRRDGRASATSRIMTNYVQETVLLHENESSSTVTRRIRRLQIERVFKHATMNELS